MIKEINKYRNAARIFLMEITIPEIEKRLIAEMDTKRGDDFQILGRVVGELQKRVLHRIGLIKTAKDLKQISRDFAPDKLELSIRSGYVTARCKKLRSDAVNVQKRWNYTVGEDAAGWMEEPDMFLLADIASQYHLGPDSIARVMQHSSEPHPSSLMPEAPPESL